MTSLDAITPLIRDITKKNGALNVRVFGSMARGTGTSSSDLDLLIDLTPGMDLFDLIGLKQELENKTGLKVDVITEKSLSRHLRQRILDEAKPL